MTAFFLIVVAILLYLLWRLHSRLTKVEKALSFNIRLVNLQSALISLMAKDIDKLSGKETKEETE